MRCLKGGMASARKPATAKRWLERGDSNTRRVKSPNMIPNRLGSDVENACDGLQTRTRDVDHEPVEVHTSVGVEQ